MCSEPEQYQPQTNSTVEEIFFRFRTIPSRSRINYKTTEVHTKNRSI